MRALQVAAFTRRHHGNNSITLHLLCTLIQGVQSGLWAFVLCRAMHASFLLANHSCKFSLHPFIHVKHEDGQA